MVFRRLIFFFVAGLTVFAAQGQTLRYTVTANVPGIAWGTDAPNCANNQCLITITGVGSASTAAYFGFTCNVPPCNVIGEGSDGYWNRSLTNLTVTVYDPITGTTFGSATLPPGFYTSFDNYNGGIGFGTDVPKSTDPPYYGGPAYPVSVYINSGGSPYAPQNFWVFYDLMYPVLVGGHFDNCPDPHLSCTNSTVTIPVTLADHSVVPLSVPSVSADLTHNAQYWVQDEPSFHQWTAATSMLQPRFGHTATLLSNGNVLVVGGAGGASAATTAEIYDPSTDSWSAASPPACGRTSHTATLLSDGRVLVVGGTQCPASAEIFNPASGTWSPTAAIPVSFPGPTTAVLLQDNRVLVAGLNGGEIYNPTVNTWSALPPPLTAFSKPVAALLRSGSVLLLDLDLNNCIISQIFAPASGTWSPGPSFSPNTLCSQTNLSATSLSTGDVLVYGVETGPNAFWVLYQAASNTWGGTQYSYLPYDPYTLPIAGNAVAQTVQDGLLLVGGNARVGQFGVSPPPTIQLPAPISPIFRPAGLPPTQPYGLWLPEPALSIGRTDHAVVTLQSGDVLAIGGQSIGASPVPLASVERLNMGTLPNAVAPTFGLAGGTYNAPQSFFIQDDNPNQTFYYTYTPSGSTPTTSSTKYTSGFTINTSGVVEAIATEPYHNPSPVTSAKYTITAQVATKTTLTASVNPQAAGSPVTFTAAVAKVSGSGVPTGSVTFSDRSTQLGKVTLDGTGHAAYTTSALTAGTHPINAAYGGDTADLGSSGSVSEVIQPLAATPVFSPAGGTYTTAQSVKITDTTAGATIYYTTNGSTPTTSSTKYSSAITVSTTKTLKAIAVAAGHAKSSVATATYTLKAATPVFSPVAGTYTTAQSVKITDATAGAAIYYTTNGSTPTTSSTKYTSAITVSTTKTLKAIAVAAGDANSSVATATYTLKAATPVFSPIAGTYTTAQSVKITDATPGATIHYTTNGSTPTTSSTKYSGAIKVSTTKTLKAIAVASGFSQSNVATTTYTIP